MSMAGRSRISLGVQRIGGSWHTVGSFILYVEKLHASWIDACLKFCVFFVVFGRLWRSDFLLVASPSRVWLDFTSASIFVWSSFTFVPLFCGANSTFVSTVSTNYSEMQIFTLNAELIFWAISYVQSLPFSASRLYVRSILHDSTSPVASEVDIYSRAPYLELNVGCWPQVDTATLSIHAFAIVVLNLQLFNLSVNSTTQTEFKHAVNSEGWTSFIIHGHDHTMKKNLKWKWKLIRKRNQNLHRIWSEVNPPPGPLGVILNFSCLHFRFISYIKNRMIWILLQCQYQILCGRQFVKNLKNNIYVLTRQYCCLI